MKLNSSVENEATLSGVVNTSSFKINASAKAFSILSSALYSNKIRAIIRELSTNARDSHISAGKATLPFEVHLPSDFESWFSVKDFGLGLDAAEVTSIYTTYFESTKTNSNDLVGCLGLGSKSPFSYTDNFTVTAIKNGKKGIYTAFINDAGIPSIALLSEVTTLDEPGVEVKFAVNDRADANKFKDEATRAFTYFDVRPVFTGLTVPIVKLQYSQIGAADGVNVFEVGHPTVAVMGSIAYPIVFPNPELVLGPLAAWLKMNLEIKFEIGALEVQPSREGLSFTSNTINAIKDRLQVISDQVSASLIKEANKIKNHWERAAYLMNKSTIKFWANAASQYILNTKFPLLTVNSTYYSPVPWTVSITDSELAEKFNISIVVFAHRRGESTIRSESPLRQRIHGQTVYTTSWQFTVSDSAYFVVNKTKVGLSTKAKQHWKTNRNTVTNSSRVIVLNRADSSRPIDSIGFFAAIKNPHRIIDSDSLITGPKSVKTRSASVVKILKLSNIRSSYRPDMTWEEVRDISQFDDTTVYYYLPLSGHTLSSEYGAMCAKSLVDDIINSKICDQVTNVYGVRIANIASVKARKNWIDLESYIISKLTALSDSEKAVIAAHQLKIQVLPQIIADSSLRKTITHPASHMLSMLNDMQVMSLNKLKSTRLLALISRYPECAAIMKNISNNEHQYRKLLSFYPMLSLVPDHLYTPRLVAQYINLVDSTL